ncbi:lysozyme [Pseudarthrobacter sp. YS3]|uniref:lysozyme n=1 Tax=Pseudarthrobacter sp. YS3 TaxID=3453718 RepID=UPI003EEE5FCA
MPTFGIQGLDVSGHQTSVDWQQQWNMGARFAYVKASEGNYFTNDYFNSQYQGSRNVGMIRGAYHFAIPNWSSGADQARYFVQNGGGWSADGYTMPPVLDFEFNPYEGRTINGFYFGNTCYGMSPAQLGSWVRDFGSTMQALTGRLPVVYTNTSWWNQCLGNPAGFGDYPLWIAAYPSYATDNAGPVPTNSWSTYSMWQYSSTGPLAGDSNVWNGDYAGLQNFARYADGASTRFVIGPNSSTIYAVADGTKYPIPDWETFQLYAKVSALTQVSQTFLDQLSTGPTVGRFARSSDGSIFMIDAGSRLHVPSCTMMYDFGGGSCTAWVPLSPGQIATFSDGGVLANATVSPSGKLFHVSNMTKREFFDAASLSAAGLPSAVVSVSDAVTSAFPYAGAPPIIRPDVIAVDRNTRQPFIYTVGKLLPVSTSVNAENAWANTLSAAALDPQSISKLVQGPAFVGFASNEAGSARYVIGPTSKFPMADQTQWPVTTAIFSNSLLGAIGTGPTISSPVFIKSSSSAVVYRWDKSLAREVPDLSTLTQLGFGSLPFIYTLSPTSIQPLPKGPTLLPLAKLAVGDSNPIVYLIDGADKMLQLEDFRITNSMGIGAYSRVPQSALAPYTATATVQPVVRCALNTYLGYGGGIWKLPATTATAQLPARDLAASTCSALPAPRGNLDTTVFVKALDSPVVYLMVDGTKRPVASWTRLVELNNGSGSPVIAEYSRTALDPVPTGSPV